MIVLNMFVHVWLLPRKNKAWLWACLFRRSPLCLPFEKAFVRAALSDRDRQ